MGFLTGYAIPVLLGIELAVPCTFTHMYAGWRKGNCAVVSVVANRLRSTLRDTRTVHCNHYPCFFGGGGGGGGGLVIPRGFCDTPLVCVTCLEGGGIGTLAMINLLGLSLRFAYKFHHFNFTCGYQNCGHSHRWLTFTINQPFSLCYSEMALFWLARPLFGPPIKVSLTCQVQYDIATTVPRKSGVPLRWIRCFPGNTAHPKKSMQNVAIRNISRNQGQHDRDQDR